MTEEQYDVIVIGSGVCGAIAAWRLRQAGCDRVLMLEAGEEGPDRMELVGAFGRAWRKSPGSPYRGRDGDVMAPGPETDDKYYQHVDGARSSQFKSTYLRRVGGSTWHFLGNTPRFVPADFRLRERYGVGVDWPLSYDDLEPDYCEAEALLGVSGDHAEWDGVLAARRSQAFPMPPIWESYLDRVVRSRLGELTIDEIPVRIRRTPQARNSRPYDGRPPCAGNSSCVPICPIQAKYDATVHVAKAVKAGVVLRTKAVVTRLEVAEGGAQIGLVHYRDWSGQEHSCAGRMVVLAAHAIESAKILLFSDPSGNRIANSSDQVGRNLMDHPQGAGGCLMPEPVYPFRGPPTTSGIDDFRDGPFRRNHAGFRMSLGNDGWGGRIESPARTIEDLMTGNEHLFGSTLRERVHDRLTRQFRISYSTELLPDPENRVTLSAEMDPLGVAKPALRFRLDDYNLMAIDRARAIIRRIFEEIEVDPASIKFGPDDDELFTGAGHIAGTCRMGTNRHDGVVDRDGRSFDHPNLFILGSSVFPTIGTANPTLTAVALTLRATRRIREVLTGAAT